MMARFVPILLLALSLALSSAGAAQAHDIEVRTGIAFGPDPAEMLDVCLPPQPGPPQSGPAHPAVLLMHGGGWSGSSRRDMIGYCREFAGRGLVAVSIDYRLAGKPGGAWPAQLQDAQLAVRWLRVHAGEFGVDPARICAGGDSAGAHLAVFLAVLPGTLPGDRAQELQGVSSAVACALDNFAPVDFTVPAPFLDALPRLAGSKDKARIAALAREVSPLFLVSPTSAPIMIAQGDNDVAVPPAQSEALRDALRRAHVPEVYVAFPGGHEFVQLPVPEKQAILQLEAAFVAAAPPRPR